MENSRSWNEILPLAAVVVIVTVVVAYIVPLALRSQPSSSYENIQKNTYENVSPSAAKILIDSGYACVLDVRTPDEFENGHIPNAILVPIDELDNSTFLKMPKDVGIICYCRSGRRSSWAAEYLSRQGYTRAYNLSGGILAWENHGYRVVEARENKPECSCVVLGE